MTCSPAEIGEFFPRIYGELNIDAVYQVIDFEAKVIIGDLVKALLDELVSIKSV